jgi:hypothetical protein
LGDEEEEEEEEVFVHQTFPAEHTLKTRKRDIVAVHGTVWHRSPKLLARWEDDCILEAYHAAHCLL